MYSINNILYIYIETFFNKVLYTSYNCFKNDKTLLKNIFQKTLSIVLIIYFFLFCTIKESIAIESDTESLCSSDIQSTSSSVSIYKRFKQHCCNMKMLAGSIICGTLGCAGSLLYAVYGPQLSTCVSAVGSTLGSITPTTTTATHSAFTSFVTNSSTMLSSLTSSIMNSTTESAVISNNSRGFGLQDFSMIDHGCPQGSLCVYNASAEFYNNSASVTPVTILPLNASCPPAHNNAHTIICFFNNLTSYAVTSTLFSLTTSGENCTTSLPLSTIVTNGLTGYVLGSLASGILVYLTKKLTIPPSIRRCLKKLKNLTVSKESLPLTLPVVVVDNLECVGINNSGMEEEEEEEEETLLSIDTNFDQGRKQTKEQWGCNYNGQDSTEEEEEEEENTADSQIQHQHTHVVMVHAPATQSLLPEYSLEGQISSLQCMQGSLLGISEQIEAILKLLALKISKKEGLATCENYAPKPILSHFQTKNFYAPHTSNEQFSIQNHVFSFTDSYISNMEHKIRIGRIGIITNLSPIISIGVSYHCHNDTFQKYKGLQLGNAIGSVKSKIQTKTFSNIISINPYKSGVTGHIASCYGWGNMITTRNVTQKGIELNSKGKPNLHLTGGSIQIGYNLIGSKNISFTPYIEGLITHVTWSRYKERHGQLPCSISKNQEKIWRYAIGLRNHWQLTNTSQLQTYITTHSGYHKMYSMDSRPLVASINKFTTTIPEWKGRFSKIELGLTYLKTINNMFTLELNGMTQYKNTKKSCNQYIQLSFQYRY